MLHIAVSAAVNLLFPIRQLKNMRNFLLRGSDTSGVFTFNHIGQSLRQFQMLLFLQLSVFNPVNGDIAVYVAQHFKIQFNLIVNLDDVLFSVFAAAYILDNRHAAVQLIQPQVVLNLHALSRFDMVQNNSCIYAVNIHSSYLLFDSQ